MTWLDKFTAEVLGEEPSTTQLQPLDFPDVETWQYNTLWEERDWADGHGDFLAGLDVDDPVLIHAWHLANRVWLGACRWCNPCE